MCVCEFFFCLDTKEESSSLSCARQKCREPQTELRHPVLSVPYGSPLSQFDIGCTLACKIHCTSLTSIFSSRPSQHPVNVVEISNFPVIQVHNFWSRSRKTITQTNSIGSTSKLHSLKTAGASHKLVWRCMFVILHTVFVWGGRRQIRIQCWSNPHKSEVLSKPLWPLCSCAAMFTLAPLALNTSHIFLTLGSSRLTLGHVNSELPVSRDQSTRCLFGPAPYVCVNV